MKLKVILGFLSLTLNYVSIAGVMCAGETAAGTRIFVEVFTSGHFDTVESGSVDIYLRDGTHEKNIKLSKEEIVHYFEGCNGPDCKNVMIGINAFENNFYPVNVMFKGPDYSTSTVQAYLRVKSLLDNKERKKLPDNSMNVSKMDPELDMNARYTFTDVVCVMTPKI